MFACDCPPYDCAGRVQLYLEGERSAGDELVQKFQPLVWRIVQKVLGPGRREEWEDACQAIFLRVFAHLGTWEQRCPFCKWLAIVAARRAIDFVRLSESMERLPADDVPAQAPPVGLDGEALQRLDQIVARFPPSWRQIWKWWTQGVRREDMAQRIGKSVRTVQYWLAEMLDEVREKLGD